MRFAILEGNPDIQKVLKVFFGERKATTPKRSRSCAESGEDTYGHRRGRCTCAGKAAKYQVYKSSGSTKESQCALWRQGPRLCEEVISLDLEQGGKRERQRWKITRTKDNRRERRESSYKEEKGHSVELRFGVEQNLPLSKSVELRLGVEQNLHPSGVTARLPQDKQPLTVSDPSRGLLEPKSCQHLSLAEEEKNRERQQQTESGEECPAFNCRWTEQEECPKLMQEGLFIGIHSEKEAGPKRPQNEREGSPEQKEEGSETRSRTCSREDTTEPRLLARQKTTSRRQGREVDERRARMHRQQCATHGQAEARAEADGRNAEQQAQRGIKSPESGQKGIDGLEKLGIVENANSGNPPLNAAVKGGNRKEADKATEVGTLSNQFSVAYNKEAAKAYSARKLTKADKISTQQKLSQDVTAEAVTREGSTADADIGDKVSKDPLVQSGEDLGKKGAEKDQKRLACNNKAVNDLKLIEGGATYEISSAPAKIDCGEEADDYKAETYDEKVRPRSKDDATRRREASETKNKDAKKTLIHNKKKRAKPYSRYPK